MKHTGAVLLAAAALLALQAPAWGIAVIRYPAGRNVGPQPGWSSALIDLANTPGRVDGFGLMNGRYSFYFAGDAEAFARFFERYTKIEGTPLRLVLHAGRTDQTDPRSPKTTRKVAFDWQLRVVSHWKPRSGLVPRNYKPRIPPPVASLEVYLGGQIGLDDLDVPLSVDVQSGGEIGRFVAEHQAKQSLIRKDAAQPKDAREKPSPAPSAK